MIQFKTVYFSYDEELVLKNVNMEIKENCFTAIIGSNGSGKTTLAKHINALLLPTKGSVLIDGLDTKQYEIAARKKVGFVFQNFDDQLIHSIVEDDIAFGLENLELSKGDIKEIIEDVLNKIKIQNLAKSNVNMLSLGQRQLVAIAGVLAMKPKYIIFDEPTTMLDAMNKKNIIGLIRNLNKQEKITIVLVTNILEDLIYADNIVVLKNGMIIYSGKKSYIKKNVIQEAGLDD